MGKMCRPGMLIDVNNMSGSVACDMAYHHFVIAVIGAEVQRPICHTNNECRSGS
jgi:hypothetical protein